jgi:magnesium chelatase subunit D
VEYSYKQLEDLPTGGKTPLADALLKVNDYMTAYARSHIGERCFVILVTDGRANVPLQQGADANEEVQKMAEDLQNPSVKWIVVDAGMGFPHFDNAERLAEKLGARYFKLEDLDADRFAEGVKTAIDS